MNLEKNKEINLKVCTRCIYDEHVDQITFNQDGVCNYCLQVDDLIEMYGTANPKGRTTFEAYIAEIKNAGKRKKYDVIIGVSGGTDSSFMLHLAVQHGLRPLAVHYDNTWNTSIATQNIQKMTSALNIDLYTHVVDNKEVDDIYKAFLYSGVSEIEASTDLALAEVMYRAASKFNVKYIFEGHSFIEEGITPLGKNYFDGKYIKGIHEKFGKLPMKTYPLMTFSRFLYWSIFKRIRKIRPFWYINYNKQEAKDFLRKEYGWEYYGGHHLENRMTAFCHSFYFPNKFKVDYRNNTLSAEVRNKKTSREEALRIYNTPPYLEENLLDFFKKRLSLSDKEFESIMNQPLRYWYEFPTYKKRFERLRPLFFLLAKTNLVPMSFYLKYCFPSK